MPQTLIPAYILSLHLQLHSLSNQRHPDSHGFSSYLFMGNKSQDHCIIGHGREYRIIRQFIWLVLIFLSIVIFHFITKRFAKSIKKILEKENKRELGYFNGSVLLWSIPGHIFLLCNAIWHSTQRYPEAKFVGDVKIYYASIIFLLLFYPFPIFCCVWRLFKKVSLEAKLADLYPTGFCCFKNPKYILFFHCVGLTSFVSVIQIMTVHAFYITIAVFIIPLQSLLLAVLSIPTVWSVIGLTATLLEAMDKQKIPKMTKVAFKISLVVFLCYSMVALVTFIKSGGTILISFDTKNVASKVLTIILIKFSVMILSKIWRLIYPTTPRSQDSDRTEQNEGQAMA